MLFSIFSINGKKAKKQNYLAGAINNPEKA